MPLSATPDLLITPRLEVYTDKLHENAKFLANFSKNSNLFLYFSPKCTNLIGVHKIIQAYISGWSVCSPEEGRQVPLTTNSQSIFYHSPIIKPDEVERIIELSPAELSLNSINQLLQFSNIFQRHSINVGVRVKSSVSYDPSRNSISQESYSQFGITRAELDSYVEQFGSIGGLHFHMHTDDSVVNFKSTLGHIVGEFNSYFDRIKWLNLGGGVALTKDAQGAEAIIPLLREIQSQYGIKIIVEPGQAFLHRSGSYVATIVDVFPNGIAILDLSAIAHVPECIQTRTKPKISGTVEEETPYKYTIYGRSCSSLDVFGEYYFSYPVSIGQIISIEDQLGYTTVQTSSFNSLPAPSVVYL